MAPRWSLLGLALVVFSTQVLGAVTPMVNEPAIQARGEISHDAVVGFAETVPSTTEGNLMLKFKPFLKVFNGCVPFPAVDADGNTGGGLDTSGDPSGKCSSSTGQVYARAATFNNTFAVMYSWYMPKDEPSDGLGHRHDWEEAIAWLSDNTDNSTLVAFSVSAHGGLSTTKTPSMAGTNPFAGYISNWPVNHQLIQTDTQGGAQPLIAWDSLTTAAQDALQNTDFGDAIVPFKDSTFTANLEKGFATI